MPYEGTQQRPEVKAGVGLWSYDPAVSPNIGATSNWSMQVPYIVGRWVRGSEHYARRLLIEHLLTGQDAAYWLVGTRRIGKTSLLRQLELTTREPGWPWVALFVDLQGCRSPEDISDELHFALEDAREYFMPFGIDVDSFADVDAIHLLRRLNRMLAAADKRLLLLVDEAEVLLTIAKVDNAWLARLRKSIFEGRQRTIVASTKLLGQLATESSEWVTSPFLFGFNLKHIWPFDRESAERLVRQSQSDVTVNVAPDVMNDILTYTNHHPHLIQYLCQRLYIAQNPAQGYLRSIEEQDLQIDHLLDAFLRFDFEQLSSLERGVLLTVAEASTVTTEQITMQFPGCSWASLQRVLSILVEVGQLRRKEDTWTLGNEFLRRWLLENRHAVQGTVERNEGAAPAVRLEEENVAALVTQYGVQAPRTLPSTTWPMDSEVSFFHTIQGLFKELRHLVEQDDGHKLLVSRIRDGNKLRSEEEIQIAFKHWLRPMCEALNIDLNREPLTGRGYLDFKFSIGRKYRCLVEAKLFNSAKLHDGVAVQLPLYLLADRAKYGIYIPVFLRAADMEAAMPDLVQAAFQRGISHQLAIEVIGICAEKPASASKAPGVEAASRYSNPTY